jgi:hypothetical protein
MGTWVLAAPAETGMAIQKIAKAQIVLIDFMTATTAPFQAHILFPIGRGWNRFSKLLFAAGPA